MSIPLVELLRNMVESLHQGSVAVTDMKGGFLPMQGSFP